MPESNNNVPENPLTDDSLAINQTLNLQTAQIPWLELQRSYAQGRVIAVRADLDLIETATLLVENNTALIEKLIDQKSIMFANDDQAKKWFENDRMLWAVVVPPWVLVQDRETD
ncbi:DUF2288 family protein [Spongorhabdus nitratireducens]